ncbi:GSCFA domain-containing protein [Niastella koreensis]|uniref:GSCFA domain protein n=2 Tax=Niastella koreensis TaxID=354356 RepID=G8TR03_NIAKG|nr:GSCFA domain-containing protein [Niastella koreensis]AEV97902.1 GSCFA domain protein [Niastella koreensis GR20-10]OQP40292.1 GSCFA domain-containing protein [Niastella koreensis]
MDLTIPIQISTLSNPINYQDNILLMGSCFTEHIGDKLDELKFSVLQNPNGILFDPASVVSSLVSYIQNKQYQTEELFYYNEVWQSWQHHSRFSKTDLQECLRGINESQQEAHNFLKTANWLIITLGTSFSYRLTEQVPAPFRRGAVRGGVANNHRMPAGWFNKHMLTIEETTTMLDNCLHQLFQFNPNIKVIFTVSPVRHIRDGVIDNNRSKARLIEVVHHLVNKFDKLYYFPAYELVIDVLRDYRFYDIDMVHPNYQATSFVLDKFMRHFVDEKAQQLAEEIKKIVIARKHKPFQPSTEAHKKFLKAHLEKAQELQKKYPFLNLDEDIRYFLQ